MHKRERLGERKMVVIIIGRDKGTDNGDLDLVSSVHQHNEKSNNNSVEVAPLHR